MQEIYMSAEFTVTKNMMIRIQIIWRGTWTRVSIGPYSVLSVIGVHGQAPLFSLVVTDSAD